MSSVPRVQHVSPQGLVIKAKEPIPVVALITWYDGRQTHENGAALAWTTGEVLVSWTTPWGDPHQVWIPLEHVHRRVERPGRVGGTGRPDRADPRA